MLGQDDPAVITAKLSAEGQVKAFELKLILVMSVHWPPEGCKIFEENVTFSLHFLWSNIHLTD